MGIKTFTSRLAAVAILLSGLGGAVAQEQVGKVRSLGTIVGAGPYSFPEKAVLNRYGNLYILDSELSNVFVVNMARASAGPRSICSPRTPSRASDMSVDGSGAIWILASLSSKVIKLDNNCRVQRSFTSQRPALGLQLNSADEVIVLTSTGSTLFDLYDQNGTLIRSFGRRISYGDPISDGELSNGHLVADRTGGFYFSFNYPPLVQHYGRDGKLLGEFKPQSNVYVGSADVSSQRQGNILAVHSNYQILVLDMTLDERGRLIFLMSGKPKYQAMTEGSQTLLVTTGRGTVLRKLIIEDVAFHRLVAGHAALYLLRNRDGLRLDKYELP